MSGFVCVLNVVDRRRWGSKLFEECMFYDIIRFRKFLWEGDFHYGRLQNRTLCSSDFLLLLNVIENLKKFIIKTESNQYIEHIANDENTKQ